MRFETVKPAEVFTISVSPVLKSADVADCHFTILPVNPFNTNGVLLLPVHTVAFPLTAPPILCNTVTFNDPVIAVPSAPTSVVTTLL